MLPDHLEAIKIAFTTLRPFVSGVIAVSAEDLNLFYNTEDDTRYVHFPNANAAILKPLYQACDPVTTTTDGEEVPDERFVKMGTMDTVDFATSFDLPGSGLLHLLNMKLLSGDGDRVLHAERGELSVFAKDAVVKPHSSTPRGQNFLGTLVLIFPTKHTGGGYVLRFKDQDWVFDPCKAMKDYKKGPSVAYIAVEKGVEQEVEKLRTGYRVALTYNLSQTYPDGLVTPDAPLMQATLATLLDDPTFMSNGGRLAFGLQRQYSLPRAPGKLYFSQFTSLLRGPDADLEETASRLSLFTSLCLWYEVDGDFYDGILCDFIPKDGQEVSDDMTFEQHLVECGGDRVITSPGVRDRANWEEPGEDDEEKVEMEIIWITDVPKRKDVKTTYSVYREEPSWVYGSLCLVMEVGPPDQRKTMNLS
ncbi:hypothetical protein EIP91_005817 [Steccherinum ochraceum]|uniref:Uncharacterized protein n=1 Tax=Steccherinum ochraceum TaxID=92696 RepID=A0A4R0R6Z3_9APHY|nr:hypothetical protein EIP91_005817 [Steccherinum ochraceum]